MGYLLKEALKTICGVNQWSYAVFWKIGCSNPNLLVLEEWYYEAVLPEFSRNEDLEIDFQARDKVHCLVNKMMTDTDVKIIGEGLVGSVAFRGDYRWLLLENCCRESHPPHVLKEVYEQISAGMQTVAVISVLPLGVVQLGSYSNIAENIGFVNNVVSLVLQLGHTPGALRHENYPLDRIHKIEHVANSVNYGNACFIESRPGGDDLFNVFGADFKNEMFCSRSGIESENINSSEICCSNLDSSSGSITYSAGSSCVYDPWAEKSSSNMKRNNSVGTGYSNYKPQGIDKPCRKRHKPRENPRPRPKDRQMIQERVKELREIVPNSAKCSIDALLGRTIKHMLFLQGVTNHTNKLKQTAESKITSKDGGLILNDNRGATWAYEVGSQSTVCPIMVEDLNRPHQMLVEMLCEERGLFLEIADIIRGLGLTILKGLMENRNDKIWARFTVEANRNVTRMEIFLSLIRVLDQTTFPQQPNSENINDMYQGFHQAVSIPGGPVGIC